MFDRLFRRSRPARGRAASSHDVEHLISWAAQRHGVEGYIEPPTMVTETTLMLIAHDGEWTRRRIADPQAAHRLARKIGIPCYEVSKVGYPQRMRDYVTRQRALEKRRRRQALE